jgi:LptD protein
VYTDLRDEFRDSTEYGIFDEALFGRPFASRQDMALSYSLGNVVEFKYYSARRDTVIKKRLFDNLVFSGNYNFSADTLKWSTISTGGLFRLFKGATNITWNVTFDPYITDARGRRVNRYVVREQDRLFRMTQFGVAFNTGFSVNQLRTIFSKKEGKSASSAPAGRPASAKDDLLSLFEDFRVDHRIGFERRLIPTGFGTERDTFIVSTNNLSISGSIPLTSKWRIDVGNISYDLQEKRLVYPDIGFSRDLHCWMLSLSWQPTRGTYYFSINVKPGTLDFLKVPYRKNVFDAGL